MATTTADAFNGSGDGKDSSGPEHLDREDAPGEEAPSHNRLVQARFTPLPILDRVPGGPVVYRGASASAYVVAGFLRNNGWRTAEYIAPTPYVAGPLGHSFVRVGSQSDEARLLLAGARVKHPLPPRRFGWPTRIFTLALLVWHLFVGA